MSGLSRRLIIDIPILAILIIILSLFSGHAYAAYSDKDSELSRSYKQTTALTDSDLFDAYQKNYQGSGSGNNYLFETAEWTNKDNGEAKLTITLDQDAAELPEIYPLYLTTFCNDHGFHLDVFKRNIKDLVRMYGMCDVVVFGSNNSVWPPSGTNSQPTPSIEYWEMRFTPDMIDAELNSWVYWNGQADDQNPASGVCKRGRENQPGSCFLPFNHYSTWAAKAIRQYFFGDVNVAPKKENAIKSPYVVYTSCDGNILQGPTTASNAYATDDLYQFLVDEFTPSDSDDRWISMVAEQGSKKVTINQPSIQNSPDTETGKYGQRIVAALLDPRNWFDSKGRSEQKDYMGDYGYSQTFSELNIKPVLPDFAISGAISDLFTITNTNMKYNGNTITPNVSGNTIQFDITEYEGGAITGDINIKLKDSSFSESNKWIDVNGTLFEYSYGSNATKVNSPKLAVVSDLNIDKKVSSSKTQAGEKLTYTITVTNKSKALAQEAIVKDTLPNGMIISGEPTSSNGTVSVSADKKSFESKAQNLGGGESYTITYSVEIEGSASGTLTNIATVNGNKQAEKSASANTSVIKPVLSITKTSDAPSYQIDDVISYTVTIQNTAPETVSHNTKIVDTLPADIILQPEISSTQGTPTYNSSSNSWTLSLGDLAYNVPVTVKYTAIVGKSAIKAKYVNIAIASASYTDEQRAECSVSIKAPKLSINKKSIEETVQNDDEIHYQITVQNTGDGEARNVVLEDNIPTSLSMDTNTITMDHFALSDGVVDNTLSFDSALENQKLSIKLNKALPAQTAIRLSFTTIVNHDAPPTMITNTAQTKADNVSPIDDTDNTVRIVAPILAIEKTSLETIVQNDDEIHYDITVQNLGDGEARRLTITDTIPAEVTLLEDRTSIDYYTITGEPVSPIDFNTVSIDGDYVISLQAPLPMNTQLVLHLTATVNGDVKPCVISNKAKVIAEVVDELSATDNTIQVVAPQLLIVKNSGVSSVQIGDTVPYQIIVQNLGEGQARDVVTEDNVPTEFTLVPETLKYEERDLITIEDDRINAVIPGFGAGDDDFSDDSFQDWNNNEDSESEDTVFGDNASYDIFNQEIELSSLNADLFDTDNGEITGEGDLFNPEDPDDGIEDDNPSSDEENNREELQDGTYEQFVVDGNSWKLLLDHPLESQREIVITFDAIVNEIPSQTIRNVATTTATHVDLITSEDFLIDVCDVDILEPELSITKTVDKEFTQNGDILTYNIVVNNNGTGEARNLIITDELPNFAQIQGDISVSAENATLNKEDSAFTISLPVFDAEGQIDISYQMTVLPGYDMGTQLINKVNAVADYVEPVSAEASTIALIPGLNIIKTADIDEGMPGDKFTYTINIVQNGEEGSVETNVNINDNLPQGISFNGNVVVDADEYGQGTMDSGKYNLTIPSLPQGKILKITVPVISDDSVAGKTIDNTATIVSDDTPLLSSTASIKFGVFEEVIPPEKPAVIEKIPAPTPQAEFKLAKTGEIILVSGLVFMLVGGGIYLFFINRRKRKN